MNVPNPCADVWNRSCDPFFEPSTEADVALQGLLSFHSLAMNGGVLHATGCLGDEERQAAIDGYVFYGLNAVAEIVQQSIAVLASDDEDAIGTQEAKLDAMYDGVLPDDGSLYDRYETHYRSNPGAYAPLTDDGQQGAPPAAFGGQLA